MAFRKLHFKNVQGKRATQTLQAGELAVDETTNQLYVGDGSTAGGLPVGQGTQYITNTSKRVSETGAAISYTLDTVDTTVYNGAKYEILFSVSSSNVVDYLELFVNYSEGGVTAADGGTIPAGRLYNDSTFQATNSNPGLFAFQIKSGVTGTVTATMNIKYFKI